MRQMRSGHVFVLTVSVLLSLIYCPPVDLWYDDKVIFHYAGLLISKGGVPYRDLFDHKPPLIYFINWAGLSLGPWGLWIIDTLLVSGASLLFYQRCRENKLPLPFIPPVFFNLLIRNYLVCNGIGMTREYTAIFLLIAFSVMLGRSRYTFFLLGLLTAAILLTQQEQILPLLPFLAYAFVDTHSTTSFLQKGIQIVAGFLVIAGPLLLYFGAHHALTVFWHDAFLFNFTWYAGKQPLSEEFRAVHASLKTTDNDLPLFITATIAVTALFLRGRKKGLLVTALLATALAFGPQLITGRLTVMPGAFYYYFLSLCAVLPIMMFVVWADTGHPFLQSRISQAVFGFLICTPLLYNAIQHGTHLTQHNDRLVVATPEYQFLQRQPRLSDYELYVMANSNWIYAYDQFQILAPSRWIYHHLWSWFPAWDADQRILKSIGHDLLAHQTRYIIDYSDSKTFYDPAAYAWWKNFLQEHYQPVTLPTSTRAIIWQLRASAADIPPPADLPAW
jgi:hypothetical protein